MDAAQLVNMTELGGCRWTRRSVSRSPHLLLGVGGLEVFIEITLGCAQFGLESRHFGVERLGLGEVLFARVSTLLL